MTFSADGVIAVIAAVLAVTLHEAAHAYAAWALGDHTAQQAGRLSLNPIRHVDAFGTVVLPGLLAVIQILLIGRVAALFGWARPVPLDPSGSARPRLFMALVAAAGPATNMMLAWLSVVLLAWTGDSGSVGDFLNVFIVSNLVFGLFNLLPVPPLDGGRVLIELLPMGAARRSVGLEWAGIAAMLLAVVVLPLTASGFGYSFDPVRDTVVNAVNWTETLMLRMAGYGAPEYHVTVI